MSFSILHVIGDRKIKTANTFPPIPVRDFDWCATDDNYEEGDPIGYGRTEQDAIRDLMDQLEDE